METLRQADPSPRAQKIAQALRERTQMRPKIALVLGSGWSNVVNVLAEPQRIAYGELEGMPQCGVAGHAGNFLFGKLGGVDVLILQGRFHLYEGRDMAEVVQPIAVAAQLGAEALVLTNAAGGLDPVFRPGDVMLFSDHINMTCRNPLVGLPSGERPLFIDMAQVYDAEFRAILRAECTACGIACRDGVYMQVLGPSYETPAEVSAFRRLGADAVGMSTVVEAIYAHYMGLRIAAISCITNAAAGLSDVPLCHEDVLAALKQRERALGQLLLGAVPKLAAAL